jgi:hypothetical protein
MNRKNRYAATLIFYVIASILPVFGQFSDQEFAREEAKRLRENVLIIRLPVNGPKIRFLKNKIQEVSDEKIKKSLQEELNGTEEVNKQKFTALVDALEKEYFFSSYLILPDSNYHVFVKGNQHVFLDKSGAIDPSFSLGQKQYFLLISGENEDQWVLVNADLRRIDKPFPHRATIFLSGLTRVLNRRRYYEKQFNWFNKKLNALL